MTRVLIVGGGGREHAIGWKLRQSPDLSQLLFAPGNGGTSEIGVNLPIDASDLDGVVRAAKDHRVDLVFVGPEEPLALGLADHLGQEGIACFGPSGRAARIEASKRYAKELMDRAGVPTAQWGAFSDLPAARQFVEEHPLPVVIKANGLAAGKGVAICRTMDEALGFLDHAMASRAFGDAGDQVVVEEYLVGLELSAFAVCDGERAMMTAPACDYKTVGDGDTGPNTGGIGSYSPPEFARGADSFAVHDLVFAPVLRQLAADGNPFHGILYAGLIVTADGPRVLEFNCRMGDPEAQVVLPRLEGDLLASVLPVAAGGHVNPAQLRWDDHPRVGVVMASAGYPGPYATGHPISGLDEVDSDVVVFHAGTTVKDGRLVTAGGRVLTIVGAGPSMAAARAAAYRNVARIHFEGAYYRTDIAQRAVDAESAHDI